MSIDNFSPLFINWAEVWLKGDYFPPHLKAVVIAQSANEVGLGYSELFTEHRNIAGLKWRKELKAVRGARPVLIQVPSEPHPVNFTSFDSWEAACEGYVAFVNRSFYKGWHKARTPRQYLDHLQGYRNGRKVKPAFCAWNGYQERVLKLMPDAEEIVRRVISDPGEAKVVAASKQVFLIDIGHNAPPRDTGAVGHIKEDTWTKSIGLALAQVIRSQGHEVILPKVSGRTTRASLQGRVAAANRSNANCFISLHLNAASSSGATGTEVFVAKGSSRKSRELARRVQDELVSLLKLRDRGVKTYNFYVLKATKMPAILIEFGFVTSPKDSGRIKALGPKVIADAIAKGLGINPQPVSPLSFTSVTPRFDQPFEIVNCFRFFDEKNATHAAAATLVEEIVRDSGRFDEVKELWRS